MESREKLYDKVMTSTDFRAMLPDHKLTNNDREELKEQHHKTILNEKWNKNYGNCLIEGEVINE